MNIVVNDQIHLSGFRQSGEHALIEHLNDRDIYECTLRIPYLYTASDADEWLALVATCMREEPALKVASLRLLLDNQPHQPLAIDSAARVVNFWILFEPGLTLPILRRILSN